MYTGFFIEPPFFELGPKAYIYGEESLVLARYADKISWKYRVPIIYTPQYVDIPMIARKVKHIFVFAQHMDPLKAGRGNGSVLPEAIRAAGASGVLLNHAEKKIPKEVLQQTIQRAGEIKLATLVCADTLKEAVEVAKLEPNIIIAEDPELIGVGKRKENDKEVIHRINEEVWRIDPRIRILHGAGISNGKDVYKIIAAGAQAAGSTSGVLNAPDPLSMLEEMIRSAREAWDATHI